MSASDVVIVSAARTPIGNLNGSLSSLKAHELGALVIKTALARSSVSPADVSEVVMGQVLQAGQGQNPVRQAAIAAGLPEAVTAYGVSMVCGSGLKAVAAAFQTVALDPSSIIVAGGQESMSQAPHVVHMRPGVKMGNVPLADSMIQDGLTDAFNNIHMFVTAENVAQEKGISRDEQDQFAADSQRKTGDAVAAGLFVEEIIPVPVTVRREVILVNKDEFPRPGTTAATLAKLRPVGDKNTGTITAGNASGINDGAAAVVVMSGAEATKRGLNPLCRVVAYAQAGIDPKIMGLAPVPAVKKLMQKTGWRLEDVDLFELNEAFASQSIAVIRELGVDAAKVNVNGGALALGHPIGASGARILVTLLYSMKKRNARKGVAALCIGGGMGIAMAVEAP